MSDTEPPRGAFPDNVSNITNATVLFLPDGTTPDEQRQRRNPRARQDPRPNPRQDSSPSLRLGSAAARSDHWSELQELRSQLAEHRDMIGKLKAAFGMTVISIAPPAG